MVARCSLHRRAARASRRPGGGAGTCSARHAPGAVAIQPSGPDEILGQDVSSSRGIALLRRPPAASATVVAQAPVPAACARSRRSMPTTSQCSSTAQARVRRDSCPVMFPPRRSRTSLPAQPCVGYRALPAHGAYAPIAGITVRQRIASRATDGDQRDWRGDRDESSNVRGWPSIRQAFRREIDVDEFPSDRRRCWKTRSRSTATARPSPTSARSLTYAEIDRLSAQFAAYLLGELKLKKGDRVAIMMPNCLQYPIAIFGVLRAGPDGGQHQSDVHRARAQAPARRLRRQRDRGARQLRRTPCRK